MGHGMVLDEQLTKLLFHEGRNTYRDICFFLLLVDEGVRDVTRDCPCWSWKDKDKNLIFIDLLGIVPHEFMPVIIIHELCKGEGYSHEDAVSYHMKYAKTFLNGKKYQEFLLWQRQFAWYRDHGF